jgi:hypothetical protein
LIIHSQTGQKRVLFDAVKDGQSISPKWVLPEEEQEPKESRRCVGTMVGYTALLTKGYRLWRDLTLAISNKDMESATEAKSAVEDAQREQRKKMEESGQKHVPRFFELRDGRWEPRLTYASLLCTVFVFLLTPLSQNTKRARSSDHGGAAMDIWVNIACYTCVCCISRRLTWLLTLDPHYSIFSLSIYHVAW